MVSALCSFVNNTIKLFPEVHCDIAEKKSDRTRKAICHIVRQALSLFPGPQFFFLHNEEFLTDFMQGLCFWNIIMQSDLVIQDTKVI